MGPALVLGEWGGKALEGSLDRQWQVGPSPPCPYPSGSSADTAAGPLLDNMSYPHLTLATILPHAVASYLALAASLLFCISSCLECNRCADSPPFPNLRIKKPAACSLKHRRTSS